MWVTNLIQIYKRTSVLRNSVIETDPATVDRFTIDESGLLLRKQGTTVRISLVSSIIISYRFIGDHTYTTVKSQQYIDTAYTTVKASAMEY